MDGWLKALVAATCVVLLAATGWWGWREWDAAGVRAAEAESAERLARWEEAALRDRQREECEAALGAWDGDQQAVVEAEFGEYADAYIESCRVRLRALND